MYHLKRISELNTLQKKLRKPCFYGRTCCDWVKVCFSIFLCSVLFLLLNLGFFGLLRLILKYENTAWGAVRSMAVFEKLMALLWSFLGGLGWKVFFWFWGFLKEFYSTLGINLVERYIFWIRCPSSQKFYLLAGNLADYTALALVQTNRFISISSDGKSFWFSFKNFENCTFLNWKFTNF